MAKNKKKADTTCSDIKKLVEESKALTGKWELNNEKWHKMRMRIKKEKTFPFVGCANIRMPTIETKLRKVKSALMNVVFGIRPIIQAVPPPSGRWETARKIEKFIDHLMMDVMKVKGKSIITVDQSLEKGFFVNKPYWRQEIIMRQESMSLDDLSIEEAMWIFAQERRPEEVKAAIVKKFDVDMHKVVQKENIAEVDRVYSELMSGKKEIDAKFQDLVYNFPDIALCEPERVYVPTDSGYNPQDASWVVHEFLMPIERFRANSEIRGWDGEAYNEIIDALDDYKKKGERFDKNIDVTKDTREGITKLDDTGKITIWEFYGYHDINGDGEEESAVITIAPDFNKVIRKISNPFFSGKKPFVKFFYELTDDRWFAHRGIPEMIEDIVKEIDMQHNQKLDQQTIRNAPMYIHRAGMVSKNTIQFIFGQSMPAHGMQPLEDIIRPINNHNPSVEFSYEKEQMILESKVEELIGQIDFTLQSMINKRQPRTLGEVQMQSQNMAQVFSLDAELFRSSFEELANWVWELWCQYGDDEYEFLYFGKEGAEPIKLTKEEVQGKYKITIRGNDQNTNPQVRIQKAQMIMMAQNNPPALQSGVITPVNIANAYKRFYQELDIPGWEELVSMPRPPQPPPPEVRIRMDDLTDGEQAQVLAKQGIRPDVHGRQLKSRAIIQEKRTQTRKDEIGNFANIVGALSKTEEDAQTQEETAGE